MWKNYLPKKSLILLAILLALAAGLFVLFKKDGSELFDGNLSFELNKNTNRIELDSDGDGSKDWEESLWKTNPQNPDTDGDGVNDGEEIALGRDPLKPGPDDFMIRVGQNVNGTGDVLTNQNATEAFAQDVFGGYLLLKNSQIYQFEEGRDRLAKLVSERDYPTAEPKRYSSADFKISADNSQGAVRNYGNELGRILESYPVHGVNEAVLLKTSIENNEPGLIKGIELIAQSYQNIIGDYLKMNVPQKALEAHANFVNAFSLMQNTIARMSVVYEDPLTALLAIKDYQKNVAELLSALNLMSKFFDDNGVVFTKDEKGYVITHITE